MAGVQTIEEEFLTCSICTEIYTDPCTLGCQHSYCRKCVTDYIKSRPDSVQSRTIPCAMCRQATPAPNPTRPHNEWAKQLKPSLMLQGLMDRHQLEHKHTKGEDFCFLCQEIGETIPASSWCTDCEVTLCGRCVKLHLKGPTTKKHDVYDLSEGTKVRERRKVKCKEHEGELIKFVCKDCNKTLCQTCCIIQHRKCEHVVTIESMLPEIKSALTEKRQIVEKRKKENMTDLKLEESKIEKLQNKRAGGKSEIKSAFEGVIALMRMKEKELLVRFDDLSDKQITDHQANVKSGQITNQMYQQHCEFIDQALQSESAVDMYDMYQVCLSGAVESLDTEPDTRNTSVVREITFTPNMEPLKKAVTEMGKVMVSNVETQLSRRKFKYSSTTVSTDKIIHFARSNTLKTVQLQDTIDIKHTDDTENPDPIDVTSVTVDDVKTVVVADFNNFCAKSVYTRCGKREISRLQMSSRFSRVYAMTRNTVACLLHGNSIQVVEVRPELHLISSLKTTKVYSSVASLTASTLVAGYSSSVSSVDILALSGNVLKSLSSRNPGLDFISEPRYLCTTHKGNILASDSGSKSVYCLTPNGKVVFSYKPTGNRTLKAPRGIMVTNTGDILLADSGASKIIQLRSDGTFVRDVLTSTDGIDAPWGLHVDDMDQLYVCDRTPGVIKVFGLT